MSSIDDTGLRGLRFTTEAADWFARLRSGTLSELDAARFRAWIASHPERRREFEELDCLWQELRALELSPEVVGMSQLDRPAHAPGSPSAAGAPRRRSRYLQWSLAASVSLTLAAVTWMWLHPANFYSTGIGEQRVIPLDDGSIVTLNTSSAVRVHFSASGRTVELVAGEANFEVAQDRKRPFVVQAGNARVRALGTVFDVYETAGKVVVTLIEGKVTIGPRDGPGPSASGSSEREIQLTAGQQLSYASDTPLARPVMVTVSHVSAWRTRKLDFDDTPLLEAIAEANRYSKLQIELQAPALEHAKLSGSFDAGKNDLLAEGLQAYFHLSAHREGQRIVLTETR